MLGGASERKGVSLAGSGAPLKLPPGRQGAILGCWDLALTVCALFGGRGGSGGGRGGGGVEEVAEGWC